MHRILLLILFCKLFVPANGQSEVSRQVMESYYDSILNGEVKLILNERDTWGEGENKFSLEIDVETYGRETLIGVGGSVATNNIGGQLEGVFTPKCSSSKHKLTLIYQSPDGEAKILHTFNLGNICKVE